MSDPDLRDEILRAARLLVEAAEGREPALRGLTITAIGWATVELDRAQRELGETLGDELGASPDAGPWAPASREVTLGAAARIGPRLGGVAPLILLEPDTEGRLAATLARYDEGVAAVYVRASSGIDLVLVPALTSGPGGRPPTMLAGRPPSAVG